MTAEHRPETVAARAAEADEPTHHSVIPAIYPSTIFTRDTDYQLTAERDYARDRNPTPEAPERVIAELEGGAAAMLFSSGMAAATTVFRALCRPGDHVVAPRMMYFALRKWLRDFEAWGVELTLVDATDLVALGAALRPGKTKILWLESPANPTWEVTDLEAAAALGRRAGAIVVVDSTVPTPVLTRPLALGADLVMHSATKYLAGHSDVMAGVLVTGAVDERWAALRDRRRNDGNLLGPFDAWLLLRGLRTLFVRVERQCASALVLAERLAALPGVTVRYPGLPSHPQHAIAARQMRGGFGGMLSIHTGGGAATAVGVATRLRCWTRASSLGACESLVEHRATAEGPTTESPIDLLRLSVGLEHVEDLYADLAGALAAR